jgi:hypothetical protein
MVLAIVAIGCLPGSARAAGEYPLTLTLDAKASSPAATLTATVTIRIDRLMEESRWKRVTDTLKFNGYAKFLNDLRTLPPVGAIELQSRKVAVQYAHEEQEGTNRRLVLVADRPSFFLGEDPAKPRAGYELTIVELRFDEQGGVTGTMSGAARVKPSPQGVVLDVYAAVPVQLVGRVGPPLP